MFQGDESQGYAEEQSPQEIRSGKASIVSTKFAPCTCGLCEECVLRKQIRAWGKENGHPQIFYTLAQCCAVAEGEVYWDRFLATHGLGDLRPLGRTLGLVVPERNG